MRRLNLWCGSRECGDTTSITQWDLMTMASRRKDSWKKNTISTNQKLPGLNLSNSASKKRKRAQKITKNSGVFWEFQWIGQGHTALSTTIAAKFPSGRSSIYIKKAGFTRRKNQFSGAQPAKQRLLKPISKRRRKKAIWSISKPKSKRAKRLFFPQRDPSFFRP